MYVCANEHVPIHTYMNEWVSIPSAIILLLNIRLMGKQVVYTSGLLFLFYFYWSY